MSLASEAEAERRRILEAMGQDAIPEAPPPEPTPLSDLINQTRYKLAAAVSIRRTASAVLTRARVREAQYREQLAALQDAQRLVEQSVSEPERHADEVAELEGLADGVGLALVTEDEFDGDDADDDEDDDGEESADAEEE